MSIKPTTYLNISKDKKNWKRIDIDEQSEFALNIAVQDIADFSLRKGSGSYKITLANTKNNHVALKHVFDVKANDLSYVKKKVYAQVIKNDSVLFDNYYFVLEESELTKEKEVKTYKARIFNEITNFYQTIDGKFLTDLDLSRLNHIYNSATIVNSFNNNYTNGYKYMLPYNWSGTNKYKTSDLFPSIYIKTYFDEIHKAAGYRYTFNEEDAPNIRFKELIFPFVGDLKKLLDGEYKHLQSIVRRNTLQQVKIYSPEWSNQSYSQSGNNFNATHNMMATEKVSDQMGMWDLATYTFTNPATFSAPGKLKFNININWDAFVTNVTNYPMINWFSTTQAMTRQTQNALTAIIEVYNATTGQVIQTKRLNPSKIEKGHDNLIDTVRDYNNKWYLNGPILVQPNSDKLLYSSDNTNQSLDIEVTNVTIGDQLRFRVRFEHYSEDDINSTWRRADITSSNVIIKHEYKLNIKSFTIKQEVFTDTYLVGNTLNINKFIPASVKQTDFLSSLYNMFNIYGETDPLDERHIIYKTRNTFYETGKNRGDLTDKVNFSMPITTKFIPNINEKKVILTYKHDDKDIAQKEYKETTDEVVAQQEVIFDNENVKGTKTKQISFSPTLNVDTDFGANVPLLPILPNVNPRILLDNGNIDCNTFYIEDGNNVNRIALNKYPFMSMQDHPNNPTFSIEYGPNEYYLHPTRFTYNNLFFNHYYNTFEQINTGSIVTLYMHLDDKFMSTVKMNDRFTIDNKEYYFNKIIDYKPHVTYTKVELLAADDVLKTPRRIGKHPGTTVKPGLSLKDLSVIFVDTSNNVLESVFVENELDEDVVVVAEDTDSTVIHDETFKPTPDSKNVLPDIAVVNSGFSAKLDYVNKFRSRNNLNNNPTNVVIGIDNVLSDDVNNTIVIGDNKTVSVSNALVVDNLVADTLNGISIDKITNLVNSSNKYKNITRDELLATMESRSYYITDRDLYATFDENLNGTYFRILSLPQASHYYDGIMNDKTYYKRAKYGIDDVVVYANKVYVCLGPDSDEIIRGPISMSELDPVCWLELTGEDVMLEPYIIYYDYNIKTDVYYTAYDPVRNNYVYGLEVNDYSKETQWNYPYLYNNHVICGIVSNRAGAIMNNNCMGFMYLNKATSILQNKCGNLYECDINGSIASNHTLGDIYNIVTEGGDLRSNICKSMSNVNVSQYIRDNILTGTIRDITNIVTYISYNRCNDITNSTLTAGPITEVPVNK